jgi:hypothetical protein
MKKLILLLLFIPLVSFGQDEEGSGLDKKRLNLPSNIFKPN